jgi:hypothetical protein
VSRLENFGTHLYRFSKMLYCINKSKRNFSLLVALNFNTYKFALVSDIVIAKRNIRKAICWGFVVLTRERHRARR